MSKHIALLFSVAVLLITTTLTSCATSNSVDPKLDKALADYHNWRTITTTISEKGYNTTIRSDGEYRNLLAVFEAQKPAEYSQLVTWFNSHKNQIPAPLYVEMAALAFRHNESHETILTWLMIGQNTARYDKHRCKDSTSDGAYSEILQLYPDLGHLAEIDKISFFKGWNNAINHLRKQPYDASPMWICSHGMSAFNFDKKSKPVTYADLVIPTDKLSKSMTRVLDESESFLNKHKKEDLH